MSDILKKIPCNILKYFKAFNFCFAHLIDERMRFTIDVPFMIRKSLLLCTYDKNKFTDTKLQNFLFLHVKRFFFSENYQNYFNHEKNFFEKYINT